MKNNRMRIISLILLFTMVFSLVAVPSVNADEFLYEEQMFFDDGAYFEDDTFFEEETYFEDEAFFEDEIILEEESFVEEESFFEMEPITEQDLFSEDEISESDAENDEFVMMESNLFFADLATATIPEEVTAPENTYANVAVTVEGGTAQSYKWQWFREGSTKFNDVGTSGYRNTDTDTIGILVGSGRNGWKYRCIVTLTDGSEVTSNEMTLLVGTVEPTVTATIPEEVTAPENTYANVTVTVEGGTAQSYKWQWCNAGGTKFNDVGTSGYRNKDTDTIGILAGAGRNGWKYRCIVTLTDGSEVSSNEMTLVVVTDVTINDVVYSKLTDTTCYVKAYIGNGTAVTVEANVNGLTVTEIGESAFEGKAIESIALPNSITVIQKYAFKNCTNLSSMTSY